MPPNNMSLTLPHTPLIIITTWAYDHYQKVAKKLVKLRSTSKREKRNVTKSWLSGDVQMRSLTILGCSGALLLSSTASLNNRHIWQADLPVSRLLYLMILPVLAADPLSTFPFSSQHLLTCLKVISGVYIGTKTARFQHHSSAFSKSIKYLRSILSKTELLKIPKILTWCV